MAVEETHEKGMNELPNPLTPAERAFWRRLWRQHEKEQRIAKKVLEDMMYGKPRQRRSSRKGG